MASVMRSLQKPILRSFRSICKLSRSRSTQYITTRFVASLSEQYQKQIKSNTIQYDIKQERVVKELDSLHQTIELYKAPNLPDHPVLSASGGTFDTKASTESTKPKKSKRLNRIMNRFGMSSTFKSEDVWLAPAATDIPNSLYLWGGTGTGKTMLMDLFFDSITTHRKRRVHFQTFMLELHEEIHRLEKNRSTNDGDDIVPTLSLNIAKESTILYLDEFQVTDLVEAVMLNRLLTALFHYGVICLATSNRDPDSLYLNGLKREELWMPFLKLYKDKHNVIDLNTHNYRDLGYGYGYFVHNERHHFEDAWKEMLRLQGDGKEEEVKAIEVMGGRELVCQRSVGDVAARFEFSELCKMNKGSSDYLALSKAFRHIFIENIPHFGNDPWSRNEMKRFIWLIDELYNAKNRIVCLAADRPEMLLQLDDSTDHVFEETFQFERCKKRLIQMQSMEYWDETQEAGENMSNLWKSQQVVI